MLTEDQELEGTASALTREFLIEEAIKELEKWNTDFHNPMNGHYTRMNISGSFFERQTGSSSAIDKIIQRLKGALADGQGD